MGEIISIVRIVIQIAAIVIVVYGLIRKDWTAAGLWAIVFLMALGA